MMLKNEAAAYLAGITSDDEAQAEAPTNLHMLTGEVISTSEDGLVKVAIDGLMFSEEDEQSVEIETTGGLEEGDIATILLSGEDGRGMAPFSIGAQGSVDRIVAHQIEADELIAQKAEIEDLEAAEARIGTLEVGKADISDLTAATGRITNLETNKANVSDLTAATGRITNLETNKADISDLTAATGRITNLETNKADISDLTAATGRITNLETGKADIDAANITTATLQNAWVDQILVQTGLIANNANIFTLDAIQVNAASIKSGTIDVERLIVTGQDGHKYMIHVDGQGTASYEKLDGDIIEDLTITADKIVANSITASQITTQNLAGTSGWINLHSGTFSYGTVATGGNGISWDGTDLVINGSVLVGQNQVTLPSIATTASTALANAADAEKVATNYIYAGSNGIKIANSNPATATTYQHQTATKTEFFVGGASACEFGASGARIGKTTESHAEVDYHSLQLVDKEGTTYFHVSDLRDVSSDFTRQIYMTYNATDAPRFVPSTEFDSMVVFYEQYTDTNGSSRYASGQTAYWDEIIASPTNAFLRVESFATTYSGTIDTTKSVVVCFELHYTRSGTVAFTFGNRASGSTVGVRSFAAGTTIYAKGTGSFATGASTVANGDYAHAEGSTSQANGYASHAEGNGSRAVGDFSHAEGTGCYGYGIDSHVEGWNSQASGNYTHAQNLNTRASSEAQTALGRYNIEDNSDTYAVIVGNGYFDGSTYTTHRSNALTLDWDGNITSDGGLLKLDNAQDETRTYLQAVEESTLNRTRLGTHRKVNDTDVYNNLNLTIDNSGNRSVAVSEVVPWLDMLGLTVSDTTATVGSAATSIGTNSVRRSGKVVTVTLASIQLASAISNNSYSGTIATIPSGYRPASNVYGACFAAGANLGGSYARITNAGVVAIRNQSGSSIAASTSVLPALTITYIID